MIRQGTKKEYAYSDEERDAAIQRMIAERKEKGVKVDLEADLTKQAGITMMQRYKGLGEMDAEQLWDTTMNPETRTLLKVSIEDAAKATMIFQTLMGDKVEPRREFIERNAQYVRNLDV